MLDDPYIKKFLGICFRTTINSGNIELQGNRILYSNVQLHTLCRSPIIMITLFQVTVPYFLFDFVFPGP